MNESVLIYRMIHIDSLNDILNDGNILCCNILHEMGKSFSSIAYPSLMERRASKHVPCGPDGNLLDYVAFYFAPRSPMLYTIFKGNVDGCPGGQEDIVYIISSVKRVVRSDIVYVFTDGHGVMEFTKFFDDLSGLNGIDWELMNRKYWNDTEDDPDRSRRRQAEFLVYKKFPVDLIMSIVVLSVQMKETVITELEHHGLSIQVDVKPEFYF